MKLNKTALMLGIAFIGAISFGWSSMDSKKPLSDLEMANIEALSRSELENKCGGCSTSYKGEYCCTLILEETEFRLYHPKY